MERFVVVLTKSPTMPWLDLASEFRSPDGRFEIQPKRRGRWSLVISGPGTSLHMITDIDLAAYDVDLGEIIMRRGLRVTGRVVDATGAPVSGATVQHGFEDRNSVRQWLTSGLSTTSDNNGEFMFETIASPSVLLASHPTRGASMGLRLQKDQPDITVEVVLRDVGAIRGRVFGFSEPAGTVIAYHGDEPAYRDARVEADGTFRLEHVPAGEYTLSFHAPFKHDDPGVKVSVRAGEEIEVSLAADPAERPERPERPERERPDRG